MPFKGHLFTKAEALADLKKICADNQTHINDLWERVVARFNNATKAKLFLAAFAGHGDTYADVVKVLTYTHDVRGMDTKSAGDLQGVVDAAHADQVLGTVTVPGYYTVVKLSGKFMKHRKGTLPPVAAGIKYNEGTIAYRRYANAEHYLPDGASYVEWYVPGSMEKRFFTADGRTDVWYTDGGTHGDADFWSCADPDDVHGRWRKYRLAAVD